MTTIQIELPEATAHAARDAGPVTPQALEPLIKLVKGASLPIPRRLARLAMTTHYRFHMRVSNEKGAGGRVRIRVHLGCAGLMK